MKNTSRALQIRHKSSINTTEKNVFLVLIVQRRYLMVDVFQSFPILFHILTRPFLDERNIPQEVHNADSKSFLIARDEEPDSGKTENTAHRKHNSHKNTDLLRKYEKRNGKQPKPENG